MWSVPTSMFGGAALETKRNEKHTKSCKIQISHMFPSSDSVRSFLKLADCVFASLLLHFLHSFKVSYVLSLLLLLLRLPEMKFIFHLSSFHLRFDNDMDSINNTWRKIKTYITIKYKMHLNWNRDAELLCRVDCLNLNRWWGCRISALI